MRLLTRVTIMACLAVTGFFAIAAPTGCVASRDGTYLEKDFSTPLNRSAHMSIIHSQSPASKRNPWTGVSVISSFEVLVQFRTDPNSRFEGLVQEVHFADNEHVLIEYFKTSSNGHLVYDVHGSSAQESGVRRMFVYPATVRGGDMMSGVFCHLPENSHGKKTNITKGTNVSYTRMHETKGMIIDEDRSAGWWWSVAYDHEEETVDVKIPDTRQTRFRDWLEERDRKREESENGMKFENFVFVKKD